MTNYCPQPQAHPDRCGCEPDAFQIARHSKRLVEQQRERIAALEAECEKLQLKVMVWNDGKPYAALKAERDALAAELATIKGQEPVGVVHLRKGGGISMLQVELNTPLHPGTKLYTLPAAPEGGGE